MFPGTDRLTSAALTVPIVTNGLVLCAYRSSGVEIVSVPSALKNSGSVSATLSVTGTASGGSWLKARSVNTPPGELAEVPLIVMSPGAVASSSAASWPDVTQFVVSIAVQISPWESSDTDTWVGATWRPIGPLAVSVTLWPMMSGVAAVPTVAEFIAIASTSYWSSSGVQYSFAVSAETIWF